MASLRRILFGAMAAILAVGCADWITDIPPYGSVDVDARRLSGDPVPGAHLTLYIGSRIMATGRTGEDGTHRFEFLPTNSYGVYADPPDGYVRPEEILGGPSSSTVDQGLSLPEGGHGVASFTYLKVGPGSIEARVTQPEGAPLGAVPTALYSPHSVVARSATDEDGRVRFESVPFGLWGLSFELPREFLDLDEPAPFRDGILVEDGVHTVMSVAVERCEGAVGVAVHDPGGRPVPAFPVVLYDDRGAVYPAYTGTDGAHTFTSVLCGNYGVGLRRVAGWDFEEGRGQSFVDGLRVRRGSALQTAFGVVRCEGSLRVRVVDAGGAGVAGAGLTAYNSRVAVAEGVTNGQGGYLFSGLGCDEYGVKVTPPAGYSVSEGRGSSYFDGLLIRDGAEVSVTFRISSP